MTAPNPLAGSWLSTLAEAQKTYPDIFKGDMAPFIALNMMQQGKYDDPEAFRQHLNVLGDFREKEAQRAQQLGMQSNIFGGLLKTVTDLPGKVIAARHMYGPEEATNYTRGLQSFGSVNVPRYF